jgi:hypothetical protein
MQPMRLSPTIPQNLRLAKSEECQEKGLTRKLCCPATELCQNHIGFIPGRMSDFAMGHVF